MKQKPIDITGENIHGGWRGDIDNGEAIVSSRPSPEIRRDRDREHIRKTFDLNMRLAAEHWSLADHCKRTGLPAKRFAAECYAMRAFVTGIIEGRGHALPETEREALKREWEERWDKSFGDLVGEILNINQ